MHRLCRTPCSAELARKLRETLPHVDHADPRFLEDYRKTLATAVAKTDGPHATQWLDEVVEEAHHKAEPSPDTVVKRKKATMTEAK